jgi:hypothetical protein
MARKMAATSQNHQMGDFHWITRIGDMRAVMGRVFHLFCGACTSFAAYSLVISIIDPAWKWGKFLDQPHGPQGVVAFSDRMC